MMRERTGTTRKIDPLQWEEVLDAIARHPDVAEYRASVNALADASGHSDPFGILVATVISLRTRDEVTFPAAQRLLEAAGSPAALSRLSPEQIETLIYPAGFYRTKARTLLQVAEILEKDYGGEVPASREELTALPGVGLKTANLVLALGFGIPAICVDTHVHRVANRMGWVRSATPDKTEAALRVVLPEQYWIPINQWMVAFGRTICTPGRPYCSRCPVRNHCDRVGVSRSR